MNALFLPPAHYFLPIFIYDFKLPRSSWLRCLPTSPFYSLLETSFLASHAQGRWGKVQGAICTWSRGQKRNLEAKGGDPEISRDLAFSDLTWSSCLDGMPILGPTASPSLLGPLLLFPGHAVGVVCCMPWAKKCIHGNSVSNLGGKWPATVALQFVDLLTVRVQS